MGRGTNFGTISIITTLILALVSSIKRNTKIPLFRYLIVGTLFLAMGIFAFSLNMSRRSGAKIVNFEYFDIGLSKIDENSSTLKIIPTQFQETYLYVVDYLAQGYYHTSLAFDLDFKPTFFLGNNFTILSFAKLVGIDVWEETYVYRLREKGVDPLVNWHTAYLWFASDVSFFGVPILFLFLGFLFGYSWDLSLNHDDFLSKIIFVILGNIFLFLFANNTYLSSVFYSFFFILPYWLATRLKLSK
jgi:hypothetical protein